MLLAIDSGNTNTVFAIFDNGGSIKGKWRASTSAGRTADELGAWLSQLLSLEGIGSHEIKAAIISNVVPAGSFALETLCRKYFGCEPLTVGAPGVKLDIGILVDHPEEVGADRIANAVAAKKHHGGPLIIIDFGTATTFDVINRQGDFEGCAIAPGVNLSLEALHTAAAKLPRITIDRPKSIIGKGTIAAMQSGMYWGYVSMIEGLVRRIREEYGKDLKVIATGGLADLLAKAAQDIDTIDPALTLRGLLAIHHLNQADC